MLLKWANWFDIVAISLQHGMELLCVTFYLSSIFFIGPITFLCLPYFLYAGNIYFKIICGLYLIFLYNDWNTSETGGRGIGIRWIRDLHIWKHCINYFPIDLVKTVDLSPDRNYLICIFPHGLLSYGAALNFGCNHSKWSKLFPSVRSKLTTLPLNLWLPLTREVALSCGLCSASEKSLKFMLSRSNDPLHETNHDGYTSNAVGLIVGGARETFFTRPNKYCCAIKKRRGFVRIALEMGVPLVPALSFGENNLHDAIEVKSSLWYRLIKKPSLRYANCVPPLHNGRFGLVPRRHPITTVIGAPIELKKSTVPTSEEIEETFELFCQRLKELFDAHKSKYVTDYEHVHLEIV